MEAYFVLMKRKVLALMLCTASFVAVSRGEVEVLWGVNGVGGADSSLLAINPATGAVVGTKATGVKGVSGLARNPVTKVLYAANSQQGTSPRKLYTVNETTGVLTPIGVLGSDPGFPVADAAFKPDGTLYVWRPQTNRLYTVNLSTAVPTQLGGSPSTLGSSAITFGLDGTLYMVRDNSLVTLNTSFGNVATGPFTLSGATLSVDNLFATNSAGTLYVGKRNGTSAPTSLYTISAAGVTTAAATISGYALSGMEFGLAAGPSGFKATKTLVRVKTPTVTLKGRVEAPLFVTIATKGKKASVVAGSWTLKKIPVRPGRTRLTITCVDAMGQSAAPVRVTIIRS